MLLIDIAELTGIEYNTLRQRYHKGWDNEQLIQPVKKRLPKSDLVLVENNEVYVDSRKIAEYFEKRHDNVMRDIEAGSVMMGSPCVPFKDFMRQVAFLQKNSTKK